MMQDISVHYYFLSCVMFLCGVMLQAVCDTKLSFLPKTSKQNQGIFVGS